MSVVRIGYASYSASTSPSPPATWATQATTGYVNAPGYAGSLADGSALTITSNTTYNFYNFPSGAGINADVVNVTFYGCAFLATGGVSAMACNMSNGGNNNITFSYCTFAPSGIAEPGPPGGVALADSYQYAVFAGATGTFTAEYCDCWGCGNGFIYMEGSTQANPHTYHWNYVHDLCQDETFHSDGIGFPGGGTSAYVTITGNQINSIGNTQALAYQNSPGPSTWSNFTITGNLFGGFGFTINVIDGTSGSPSAPSNITFTGNTFTTFLECGYGPLYPPPAQVVEPNWYWRNNKWLVPAGAFWGHTAYSGYYWLPGGTSNAAVPGFDELSAGLVGVSDYTG